MIKVDKYGIFKLSLGKNDVDELVIYCAEFTKEERKVSCAAFKSSANEYSVYFMPDEIGKWDYTVKWGGSILSGVFECVEQSETSHGPVKVSKYHFIYSDGTKYVPIGTTSYAWTNQSEDLQEKTLSTLSKTPFNKIRMGIFPKSMPFNTNEPDLFPFKKDRNDKWDVNTIDYQFWNNLENRINSLKELEIEADLILFHPYDRWGFSSLSQEESLKYIEYVVARLSAYSNIWWSLANEYEMLYDKTWENWNEYGELIKKIDPYHHLLSIHNILKVYPKKDWLTHCSIQTTNINNILNWRKEYNLPIIIDELGYEGNIDYIWGNISAKEMVHRFWWTVCRGGYCSHGETFENEEDILWWSKGGELHGESSPRIQFLKNLLYELDSEYTPIYKDIIDNPNTKKQEEQLKKHHHTFRSVVNSLPEFQRKELCFVEPMIIGNENFLLKYMGNTVQAYTHIVSSQNKYYKVEIIDTWDMTRKTIFENVSGDIKVLLPQKEGMAILLTKNTF